MATYTIGPVASTGTSGVFYQGKVVLNTTTNNSGNYTDVAWEFRIWANTTAQSPSNYRFQNGNQVLVVIDGQTVLNTANIGLVALSGTTATNNVLLASGSIRVYHNNDGTKNLSVNARYYQPNAPVLNTINPVGTVTLTRIVRAAEIATCPDATLIGGQGTPHTTTWTDVRDYYYKIQYLYGSTILHTSNAIPPNTQTYTWSVPGSIANYETSSKTMKLTVALHTYSDSACTNEVGVSAAHPVFTMSNYYKPSIINTGVGFSEQNKVGTSLVAGVSNLQVMWTPTYIMGATLASCFAVYIDSNNAEVGERMYSSTMPVTLPKFPNFTDTSRTYRIKISVTDSRGFTLDYTVANQFTVYGWAAPAISAVTAFRCDANEAPNLSGAYYDVSFTYSIRSLNSQNTKNAKISYKYASDNSWTQSASGALSNYSGTLNMGPYTLSQARDEKLDVKVELTDSLSSDNPTTITVTILPAEVFLDMITNDDDTTIHEGLGIGMINTERFTVQSGWPLKLYDEDGNLRAMFDYTNGVTFYDDNGTAVGNYPVDGTVIDLDNTLTIQGDAADAKAVGDALTVIRAQVGTPLTANTASAMTDQTKIYVYTGSESGYTSGNWYYYNGSSWVSGGVYNSVAIQTDTTVSVPGMAADAGAVGDLLENLRDHVDAVINGINETFTISASGSYGIFDAPIVYGYSYVYTNLTNASQTLNLYRADSTSKNLSSNLAANASVTFTPDEDDYVQIGGWFNGTGTATLTCSGLSGVTNDNTNGIKANKAEIIFDNNGKVSINATARTVSWAGKIQIHTAGGRYQIEPSDAATQLSSAAVYDSVANSITITIPYENTLVFRVSSETLKLIGRNNVALDDVILFSEYYRNDYGLLWDKYWRDLYAVDKENGIITANQVFNGEPYTGAYDYDTPVTAFGALFKGLSNVESFAFFTDPHVLGFGDDNRNETRLHNYVKRVQKTYNSTPCSFLICGGDWLNNNTTMDEACYRLGLLKGFSKHMLSGCYQVIGNHDTNYQGKEDSSSENYTGTLDNETIAAIMFRDTDTKKAYYSFNSDVAKCYVLDTGLEHNTMTAYDWEQVGWLAGRLAEDDAEHSIIFLHIIYESGSVQTNASNFGSLVQAYNNRSSVTLNGITYNFSSCTGHVDFWVAGHTHSDQTGTLGGIPFIITATNGYSSDVPLIDLFLVDYDASKIFTVRVGGTGSDRIINF